MQNFLALGGKPADPQNSPPTFRISGYAPDCGVCFFHFAVDIWFEAVNRVTFLQAINYFMLLEKYDKCFKK